MTGEELREQRKLRGLSQSGLAKLLGVDQNTVSRWETGKIAYINEIMVRLAFESLALKRQVKALTEGAKR